MQGLIEIGSLVGLEKKFKIPYVKLTNGQTTENIWSEKLAHLIYQFQARIQNIFPGGGVQP